MERGWVRVPMPGGGEIRCSAGLGRDWEKDKPDRGRLSARIEKELGRHGQVVPGTT